MNFKTGVSGSIGFFPAEAAWSGSGPDHTFGP
jgi:hypothetical protein